MNEFRCRGRVWIERDGQTFLGCGRVTLLQRIKEYGSISQAARSMGMGYRHAWDLVDSMNRNAPVPLVLTQRGGKKGGGAVLTPEGEAAIELFHDFLARFREYMAAESRRLDNRLRDMGRQ